MTPSRKQTIDFEATTDHTHPIVIAADGSVHDTGSRLNLASRDLMASYVDGTLHVKYIPTGQRFL